MINSEKEAHRDLMMATEKNSLRKEAIKLNLLVQESNVTVQLLNDSDQLPPLVLSYNKMLCNCISTAALTDVKTVQDGETVH